jgi:hypothetical protein
MRKGSDKVPLRKGRSRQCGSGFRSNGGFWLDRKGFQMGGIARRRKADDEQGSDRVCGRLGVGLWREEEA